MGKVCKTCKVDKPFLEYNIKTNTPDGRDYHCKSCKREYNAQRYRSGYAQKQRENSVRSKYGLEWADVEALHKEQSGGCAICKRALSLDIAEYGDKHKSIRIDHCHRTGKVRGLLCDWCNVGLGRFNDSPDLLDRAIQYIRRA